MVKQAELPHHVALAGKGGRSKWRATNLTVYTIRGQDRKLRFHPAMIARGIKRIDMEIRQQSDSPKTSWIARNSQKASLLSEWLSAHNRQTRTVSGAVIDLRPREFRSSHFVVALAMAQFVTVPADVSAQQENQKSTEGRHGIPPHSVEVVDVEPNLNGQYVMCCDREARHK